MGYWDLTTGLSLIFTAIVTPYEVAVLPSNFNVGFYVNAIINLVFVVDMGVCFFSAYRATAKEGGHLIKDLRAIRRHYLRGWFFVDLISVLPLDLITGEGGPIPIKFDLKILRLVKLLRLLKLLRLVKASRMFQRLESKIAVPYAYLSLSKFLVLLLISGHWFACLWVMIAELEATGSNWTNSLYEFSDAVVNGEHGEDGVPCAVADDAADNGCEGGGGDRPQGLQLHHSLKYIAGLYWSIVTITSVGYGDITPQTKLEMLVATVMLLFGSCLWAYIIGSACSILSTLDVDTIEHQQLMDQLNNMMTRGHLPDGLRAELRRFFIQRKELHRADRDKKIIALLSPMLKMRAVKKQCEWLRCIPYLRTAQLQLIAQIEGRLCGQVFPPTEEITWSDTLRYLGSGIVSRAGHVMRVGSFWGTDFVMLNPELKNRTVVNPLTYVEILDLPRRDFFDLLKPFPEERRAVRRAQIHFCFVRGIMFVARARMRGEPLPWDDPEYQELCDDAREARMSGDVPALEALVHAQHAQHHAFAGSTSSELTPRAHAHHFEHSTPHSAHRRAASSSRGDRALVAQILTQQQSARAVAGPPSTASGASRRWVVDMPSSPTPNPGSPTSGSEPGTPAHGAPAMIPSDGPAGRRPPQGGGAAPAFAHSPSAGSGGLASALRALELAEAALAQSQATHKAAQAAVATARDVVATATALVGRSGSDGASEGVASVGSSVLRVEPAAPPQRHAPRTDFHDPGASEGVPRPTNALVVESATPSSAPTPLGPLRVTSTDRNRMSSPTAN